VNCEAPFDPPGRSITCIKVLTIKRQSAIHSFWSVCKRVRLATGESLRAKRPQQDVKWWAQIAVISTLGIAMAISIVVGLGLGYLLDKKFGTRFLVLVGLGVGIFAAYRTLWVFYVRYMRDQGPKEPGPSKGNHND
jgi:F0F1-type ATP synthase assembly protein I